MLCAHTQLLLSVRWAFARLNWLAHCYPCVCVTSVLAMLTQVHQLHPLLCVIMHSLCSLTCVFVTQRSLNRMRGRLRQPSATLHRVCVQLPQFLSRN